MCWCSAEGDRVPADGLCSRHELAVDEIAADRRVRWPLPKRTGCLWHAGGECGRLFAGTLVTAARVLMQVTAIGSATELDAIRQVTATIESESSPCNARSRRWPSVWLSSA